MPETRFHEVEGEHRNHGLFTVHFTELPDGSWMYDADESFFETDSESAQGELVSMAAGEMQRERDDVAEVLTLHE